jgi:TPR repeat protein
LEIFLRGAQRGNADAQHNVGWMYERGLGVPTDHLKSVEWRRKAFEQNHGAAAMALGTSYGACFCLCLSNIHHNIDDGYQMTIEYGQGVEQDAKTAWQMYLASAERGYAAGQAHVSKVYALGLLEVKKDNNAAFSWAKKASANGSAYGSFLLGKYLQQAIGCEKDEQAAVEAFRVAAESSDGESFLQIGKCYEHGSGVPLDEKVS